MKNSNNQQGSGGRGGTGGTARNSFTNAALQATNSAIHLAEAWRNVPPQPLHNNYRHRSAYPLAETTPPKASPTKQSSHIPPQPPLPPTAPKKTQP
ncbi:MAG: hypothetical protein HKK66_06955 [Chlorobiaceae bacterium]|nr:hypothetical protein [Chlorobiaceae bacterium]